MAMTERTGLDTGALEKARALTLEMLAARAPGKTVCPSEVARALADRSRTDDWRSLMPTVHASIDELLAEDRIWLSWKGARLPDRAGPYRINRSSQTK